MVIMVIMVSIAILIIRIIIIITKLLFIIIIILIIPQLRLPPFLRRELEPKMSSFLERQIRLEGMKCSLGWQWYAIEWLPNWITTTSNSALSWNSSSFSFFLSFFMILIFASILAQIGMNIALLKMSYFLTYI